MPLNCISPCAQQKRSGSYLCNFYLPLIHAAKPRTSKTRVCLTHFSNAGRCKRVKALLITCYGTVLEYLALIRPTLRECQCHAPAALPLEQPRSTLREPNASLDRSCKQKISCLHCGSNPGLSSP